MKRFLTISTLILIYFLSCSKSCDNREQFEEEQANRRLEAEKDSIKSVFEKENLPDASLIAFREAAVLKFSDFRDYLKILADTTLAEAFRRQAGEMIRGLFISGKTELSFTRESSNGREMIMAEQLVKPDPEILKLAREFRADSVVEENPLARVSDSVYSGTLSFFARDDRRERKIIQPAARGAIEIRVIRRNKIFGKDTLNVWSVYLGKMEIR